ncbi:MAG: hypothetical protein N3A71_00220 [Candidatus Dojkabacteria bacterium]|nr:hypothetical protein [Candidatus Dojkabacteria bacterium]
MKLSQKLNPNSILELIITSRVRRKILYLFFSEPNTYRHMRQVGREIDEQINAVRRELMSLVKIDLLIIKKDGIKRQFILNPSFIFYNELRSLVMKTSPLAIELWNTYQNKELGQIKYIFLTHTFINRETSYPDNPDVVIIGDGVNVIKLKEIQALIRTREGRDIYVKIWSKPEFELEKGNNHPILYSLLVLPKCTLVGTDEEFAIEMGS